MNYIKAGQLVIIRPSSKMRREKFKTHLERIGVVLDTYSSPDTALVSCSEGEWFYILQEDLAIFREDLLHGREP